MAAEEDDVLVLLRTGAIDAVLVVPVGAYTVPKREVKEEPATPVNTRRGGSKGGAAAPSSSRSRR